MSERPPIVASRPYAAVMLEIGGQSYSAGVIADLFEEVLLKADWFFFNRRRIFSGIQFTKHFIEFIFVESNQLVSSNPNVTCPRQTCSQHSSMAAESKR